MSEAASPSQADKAATFRALHERAGAFVIANPWDAGSARMLAELGFEALATSSGASAAVRGRKDGQLSRDEALAHAREIVAATDLPVAADLENGFGESPDAGRRDDPPGGRGRPGRRLDRGLHRRQGAPVLRARRSRCSASPPPPRRRARCRSRSP